MASTVTISLSDYTNMLIPRENGRLIPISTGHDRLYPSRDHFTQMLIVLDGSNDQFKLIYVDNKNPTEIVRFQVSGGNLNITFYGQEYPIVEITGYGGWNKAASIYKNYLKTTNFYKRKGNSDNLKLILTGSTNAASYLQNTTGLVADFFPANSVGVFLTNYRNHAFDVMYPDYNVKSGFGAAIKSLVDKKVIAFPYINGLLFDSNHPEYSPQNMYLNSSGNPVRYGATSLYYAYINNDWINRLKSAHVNIENSVGASCDIYLDMVGATEPVITYNSGVADYSYFIKKNKEIFSAFSAKTIFTEAPADIYIQYVDVAYQLLGTDNASRVGLYGYLFSDIINSGGWKTSTETDLSLSNKVKEARSFHHSFFYTGSITNDNNISGGSFPITVNEIWNLGKDVYITDRVGGITLNANVTVGNHKIVVTGKGIQSVNNSAPIIRNTEFECSSSTGPCIDQTTGSAINSDYNVFTREYAGMFKSGGVLYDSLAQWRAATGNDVNSVVSSDPQQKIATGVKYWGNNPRPTSINNEPLPDTAVDIGAYQTTTHPFHPANLT